MLQRMFSSRMFFKFSKFQINGYALLFEIIFKLSNKCKLSVQVAFLIELLNVEHFSSASKLLHNISFSELQIVRMIRDAENYV